MHIRPNDPGVPSPCSVTCPILAMAPEVMWTTSATARSERTAASTTTPALSTVNHSRGVCPIRKRSTAFTGTWVSGSMVAAG
ncbi:MAG: hypothetical protein JRI25_22075 [Deltaproteobacteria bacterium]|nr:hypothetical protein [Deltaproteobacteria bacterium]